jgi:two-component system phosphate regulon sensor histidine kinase PhoR
MNKWLTRAAWVTAILSLCAAVGWLVGTTLRAPMAAAVFSAALGLGAMVFIDSLRGERLMQWLRTSSASPPPVEVGVWGEVAAQIERALRRRERDTVDEQQRLTDFLAAVEASPIGVLLLDRGAQITWCSRTAADHLGLQLPRDLRQHVTNLVRVPAFVEQLAAQPSDQAVTFNGPAGVRVSGIVRHYGNGLRLVLTQDVTEREHAESMRRNFVANVSHEIRTPLTVLSGFVETMRQLPLSEAERTHVLALMATQAQRMQTLVADLLTLAQLEGSPRPPADHWVSAHGLLQRVHADAVLLSAGRHELSFECDEDIQIAGSDAELFSALANLVVNAVRYTAAGGTIELLWQDLDDGGGALLVRDTGIGIAREHWPRLSERFYRVDGSRSRDTGGTGLGLSIVKHVAQRHGGEMDLHSELHKGSTFRILLPRSRVRQHHHTPVGVIGADIAGVERV